MEKITKTKELRSFGLLVGGIFGLIALWPFCLKGGKPITWASILAIALIAPAFIWPPALSIPHRIWMKIGHVLGWINTRLILAIIFYFLFSPLSLLKRLFGYDPLARKFDQSAESYKITNISRSMKMDKQF